MRIRSITGHMVGISLQALIVAAIAAALVFGAALVTGAPGGSSDVLAGKPNRPAPAPTGVVVVNPNPATVNLPYTISGSGYTPGTQLNVRLSSPNLSVALWAQADSSGGFSMQHSHWVAETVAMEVWQMGRKSWSVAARGSYDVVD